MPPEINEAQLRLAAIVASSEDAIISEDLTGTITSWNPAAERIFGYTEAEAIGRSILMTDPPELQEEEDAILRRVGAGEVIAHYETVRLSKNGQRVEVSLTVSPIRTPDGRIIGASKIARDLSRTQRIQRDALRLAAIVDSSDDAILSKDMNGIVMSWNPAAEAMFGFSASEMVGQPIRFIIPDDRQEEEADVLSRIRRGDRVDHYETIRRRKDGTLIPVSLAVSPIRSQGGTVVGASKIARDITGRKRAEDERQRLLQIARESSRLKDEFLATLSHELRTPLNAIVADRSGPSIRAPRDSDDSRGGVQRLRTIRRSHESAAQRLPHAPDQTHRPGRADGGDGSTREALERKRVAGLCRGYQGQSP